MSQEAIKQLIDRWVGDDEFRKKMRQDPIGTVKSSGVDLSDSEWSAFRKIDWHQTDEELKTRANNAA